MTYIRLLREFIYLAVILDAFSRPGNPYENAKAEGFIRTLEYEEIHMNDY